MQCALQQYCDVVINVQQKLYIIVKMQNVVWFP